MNPDPTDGTLLVKLLGFALLGLNIASLWVGLVRKPSERREISPQPLEVVAGDQALPRREWLVAMTRVDQEIARLGAEMTTHQRDLSELKALIAGLQATSQSQNQALALVATKLDRLIERES